MTELTLTKIRFRSGVWEGRISGAGQAGARPDIQVSFLDRPIEGVTLAESDEPGTWSLSITVPPEAIGDGVQTFLISDGDGNQLGQFVLIAGEVAEDDLYAEVDLLRAELDMLKRAFRRHCLETM